MNRQLDIFSLMSEKYKINTDKVLLIELFAGIGAQHKALKYLLGDKMVSHKIVEWAYNSIITYNDIHIKDYTDYSKDYTMDELVEKIKGISVDYNKPLTVDQIKRKGEKWVRNAYNNIIATHDLIDITNVKGRDLDFNDNANQTIIMTYSFPCQDLSNAGKREGIKVGTRSGLLYEVERILDERKQENLPLPNILLMENVPDLIYAKNVKDFNKWEDKLQQLGYSNYFQILNAKDYGIPQNRKRVFMISILGNYYYEFPKKFKLKYKLKDMLEDNVDEKYYLSDKQIQQISNWNSYENPLESVLGKESISPTITTRIAESQDGGISASMKVYSDTLNNTTNIRSKTLNKHLTETLQQNKLPDGTSFIDSYNKNINSSGVAGTITIRVNASNDTFLLVKNATKKGYEEATIGDGIDISGRMEKHRGTVQKNSIQTLTTKNDRGVVVYANKQTKI